MSKKTITIPNRFSNTPCWVGEIEATMHNTIQTIGLDAVKRMRELSGPGESAE